LQKVAEEYAIEQKKIDTYDSIIADYNAIAYATSKDGIQALLIEEALPEIEQEANRLLSKLTHNNAHIMIESLRDLKKGGTRETLDIKISDAAGIRAYELFSGGEAFRIDFALRIAISKLLARRAGTTLQTLIIDEGFGSQDEEGLSLIMDALYAIQEDFAKIIIVSHLPQMKDQFPVHFYIEKIAGSSVVHIIEQG
jgi:exonuclease SbcC